MSNLKNILKTTIAGAVIRFGSVRRNRGAQKRALLSFIIHPFLRQNQNHPNVLELDLILSALEELGYEITVVDYRRRRVQGQYDLCIGFGNAFETAMQTNTAETYVLYATGLSFPTQIMSTMKAMARVAMHGDVGRDQYAGLARLPEALWPLQLIWSDAVLVIGGNNTIRDHAAFCSAPIISAPGLCFIRPDRAEIQSTKDFGQARQNFAWFGGPGFAHKGLDLCIDYFLNQPDLNLHIAGTVIIPTSYREKIDAAPNIHLVGHLKIGSKAFRAFVERCGFVILPSCSEGMATSVITLMVNGGLVPVISSQTGIDIPEDCGIGFDLLTAEGLRGALEQARNLSSTDLSQRSRRAEAYALKHFTPQVFRAAVIEAIKAGLASRKDKPAITVEGCAPDPRNSV